MWWKVLLLQLRTMIGLVVVVLVAAFFGEKAG
jgi:hypothetical protein